MKKSLTKEIASLNNVNFYSLSSILPDPDSLLAAKGRGISLYKELLSDSHIKACVISRKSGTLARSWKIDGQGDYVDFIQNVFNSLNVEKIISDILDAPLFGFSPIEVMWEHNGENIVPKRVEAKPQEWFLFDVHNNLRLRTKKNSISGEIVPEKKFLCARYNPSYTNPYGEKLLASVFWPATFKKGGMKFWVSFVEKYGMPWALGKIPRQTLEEEAIKLRDTLENMVQDGVAVFDDSCEIELKEAGGKNASSQVYSELVQFSNSEISKAILGQTLTTQEGTSGSYALGTVHSNVRKDILAGDARLVQNVLNELISWILELNYPEASGVKFTFCDADSLKSELAARDKVLKETGVKFSKEYFARNYGLNPSEFELEEEIK